MEASVSKSGAHTAHRIVYPTALPAASSTTRRILPCRYTKWLTLVKNRSIILHQYEISSIAISQHTIIIYLQTWRWWKIRDR